MHQYEDNHVLDIAVHETPSFEEHFGSSTRTHPDSSMKDKRYLHFANPNSISLLLPEFERVRIADFLVEPLSVERVDVHGPVFTISV